MLKSFKRTLNILVLVPSGLQPCCCSSCPDGRGPIWRQFSIILNVIVLARLVTGVTTRPPIRKENATQSGGKIQILDPPLEQNSGEASIRISSALL